MAAWAVATAPTRAILLCLLLGLRGLEALLAGAPAAHGPRLRQAAKAGSPRSVFLSLRQSGQPTGQQQDGQAPPRTPSLHELVQGADQQLRNGRARQSPATKSLASRRKHEEAAPVSAAPSGTMVAWVIPSKPAVRDQLTLEQAARVHAAIRMLRAGEEVPAVMCFCGGDLAGGTARAASSTLGSDAALRVSPAALAYSFFRAVAEAQGVDVSRMSFVVEQRSTSVHDGMASTALACRNRRRSSGAAAEEAKKRARNHRRDAHDLLKKASGVSEDDVRAKQKAIDALVDAASKTIGAIADAKKKDIEDRN